MSENDYITRDHIAHDMRMGRFPEQSSIEQYFAEREDQKAQPSELTAGQHIGKRVKGLRAQRKLSLQEVADRANISKSHVWEIEQGNAVNPTIDLAVRLSRVFGVSLDYLTGLHSSQPDLHPEALRIAIEVDALLRATTTQPQAVS